MTPTPEQANYGRQLGEEQYAASKEKPTPETNDVFVFYALHGQKYEGGDLKPKILDLITAAEQRGRKSALEEMERSLTYWFFYDVKCDDLHSHSMASAEKVKQLISQINEEVK